MQPFQKYLVVSTICQTLFESQVIKIHYKARVIKAAWNQQRKSEINEQFRSSKDKEGL